MKTTAPPNHIVDVSALAKAWEDGRQAYMRGQPRYAPPSGVGRGTEQHGAWLRGWDAAHDNDEW